MGSLPNLSELGREVQHPFAYKIGSVAAQSQHGQGMLTYEEKNKILHRHSGYCRNSKIKSNNVQATSIAYDDFMLEVRRSPAPLYVGVISFLICFKQMATYSPVSSRSTRNLGARRRDSMSSSIGATSVRRLIAVVRNTSGRSGPVYTRKTLIKNLIALCLSHLFITSVYLPFLALQGSVSVWILPVENELLTVDVNVGSLLLTILHVLAALSIASGPSLVHRRGTKEIIVVSHVVFVVFYAFHLYPLIYLLIPVYVLLGLTLGPYTTARVTYMMTLSAKLSYVFPEDDEDSKVLRRTCIVRRMSRALQAAHDVGFILGSVLSAAVIAYGAFSFNPSLTVWRNGTEANCSRLLGVNCNNASFVLQDQDDFLDAIFDVDELGDRLCGSHACPSKFLLRSNSSLEKHHPNVLSETTANVLISAYIGVCVLSLVCAVVGLDGIKMFVHQDPLERSEGLAAIRAVKESFRDVKLQLAAPLAFFIGLEQAFMYSDFSKSYVVCTLGIHRLNLVFLCMGLLQSIAACTLSMLLRSIRRYYVIAVGFIFHTCLLLVQMLWKPIGDDPALFYVISAAWGVCNSIWEMLNFTFLTGLYMDNWEAPFANSTFFRFLGLAVAFGFHGVLCNWVKVYLLAFFMLVAIIPYTWLEIKLENMRKIKNISRL